MLTFAHFSSRKLSHARAIRLQSADKVLKKKKKKKAERDVYVYTSALQSVNICYMYTVIDVSCVHIIDIIECITTIIVIILFVISEKEGGFKV